jgi:hypothetical protein
MVLSVVDEEVPRQPGRTLLLARLRLPVPAICVGRTLSLLGTSRRPGFIRSLLPWLVADWPWPWQHGGESDLRPPGSVNSTLLLDVQWLLAEQIGDYKKKVKLP